MSDASQDSNRTTPTPGPSGDPDATGPVRVSVAPPPFVATPAPPSSTAPHLDDALPFQRAKTQAPPAPVSLPPSVPTATPFASPAPSSRPAFSPASGVSLPRTQAPRELVSPGALVPLEQFLASATSRSPLPAQGTPLQAARPSVEPLTSVGDAALREAPPNGYASAHASTESSAISSASPWLAGPSSSLGSSGMFSASPIEAPSATMPSTTMPSVVPPPADAHPAASERGRSFTTAALVVVAIGLAAAIGWVALGSKKKTDDPADIKAGQAQRDYELGALPTATASASASAARPARPALRTPAAAPAGTASPKSADPYEDL